MGWGGLGRAAAAGGSSSEHYFAQASRGGNGQEDASGVGEAEHKGAGDGGGGGDSESNKKVLQWKKKLREIEALEKRRGAGQKLEALQLKKLEAKDSILQELAQLLPSGASPASSPSKRASSQAAGVVPAASWPQQTAWAPAVSKEEVESELLRLRQEEEEEEEKEEREEAFATSGAAAGRCSGAAAAAERGGGGRGPGRVAGGAWGGAGPRRGKALPSVSVRPGAEPLAPVASRARLGGAIAVTTWAQRAKRASASVASARVAAGTMAPDKEEVEEGWGGEELLQIPTGTQPGMVAQLQTDLHIWTGKFGGSVEVNASGQGLIAAKLPFGPRREEARSELHAIVDFNLGAALPVSKSALAASPAVADVLGGSFVGASISPATKSPSSISSAASSIGGRVGGSCAFGIGAVADARRAGRALLHSARAGQLSGGPAGGDLSDPETIFLICDTDGSGGLDSHELRFALNAFGLFPGMDYIAEWMEDREILSPAEFKQLLKQKLVSAPTSMRRPRAIPYARRGVSLRQLESLQRAFVAGGWLKEKCECFNELNRAGISEGKVFPMAENLYALDRWVIRPATSPEAPEAPGVEPLDEALRLEAELPPPAHKCSYSELVNPNGVLVDSFVSHYWGHPFSDTMTALQRWGDGASRRLGKEDPKDLNFWLCFLALNQHRAGEEVGSSPEEGPFNAALIQAKSAVMILDEQVNPFGRIWCLFEVKRLTDLQKEFELVCSLGSVGALLADPATRGREEVKAYALEIGNALAKVSAFDARASSRDDQLAIWHRVADPAFRRISLKKASVRFSDTSFRRFDMTMRSLLATPLFQASLNSDDYDKAVNYIALGAVFRRQDLERLRALDPSHDLTTRKVSVRSSGKMNVDWTLLHCAAFFGHEEGLEALLDMRADIHDSTVFGLNALHHASRNGNVEIVEALLRRRAAIESETKDRRKALQNAAHQGFVEVVEVLLHAGADPSARARADVTALHSAAESGHAEVVECILKYWDVSNALLAATISGMTALHVAATDNFVEVVEELLKNAPKEVIRKALKTKDRKGRTPLQMAEQHDGEEAADVLRTHERG